MPNESQDVDLNNETEGEVEETNTDSKDEGSSAEGNKVEEKPTETPEARKARLERQMEQHRKKHPELYQTESPKPKPSKKSDDLDYGQKAFLVANGVKGADEIQLTKDYMSNTGKSLEEVLASKYFQSELKEMRDLAATSNATPKGQRSGGVPTDSVEYWMSKPIAEVPQEMRIKVVNARLKKEENKGQFYNS